MENKEEGIVTEGCRLCGGERMKLLYEFSAATVDLCGGCGFVQVREQPGAEHFDRIYSGAYFEHEKYEGNWASDREKMRRFSCLERIGVMSGDRVLDAGCASGDFILTAKGRFEMWGIDVSAHAVNQARARMPELRERLFVGALEEQELPENYFDAVVLWDVVEHLWDPVLSLSRLTRVLKKDGGFAFSTPNIGAWTARLMGRRWVFMTPPEHLCFFNRRTVRLLLEKSGLSCCNWMTAGKWTTLDFVFYKLKRIYPRIIPSFLLGERGRGILRLPLYVPTGDIQYVCARMEREIGTG